MRCSSFIRLISENHKSDYNETDVKILDESRTIVANGQFKLMTIKNGYLHHDRIRDSETCSIDKRKHSLFQAGEIPNIPVFGEFDIWKPYDLKCDS